MPSLVELRNRLSTYQPSVDPAGDETFVSDRRAALSPAEMVDQKLFALLRRCGSEAMSAPQSPRGSRSRSS